MWHAGGERPGPEQLAQMQEWARRRRAPDNEIPAVVPLSLLLGRNEDTAVALTCIRVFSRGLLLEMAIRLRTTPPDGGHGLHQALMGFPGADPGNLLLFGVEYADGRGASNVGGVRASFDASGPDDVALTPAGGGGGGNGFTHGVWLAPGPPRGPLTFVCAWASQGIEETRVTIDADVIVDAATTVIELWPDQEPTFTPAPPAVPTVATDSWFASYVPPAETPDEQSST
jgi:hypothetical protein